MFPGKKSKASLYLLFILIFLWAIAVTGCSATSDEMSADFTEELSTNAAEEGGETGGEDAVRSTAPNQAGEKNASPAKPRFIIYTGSLELTVRDTRKTVEEIRQITAGEGGLVSESRIYESQKGQFAADLSLRIPETRFDDFIAQLEELGEAANVHKSSEDVTLSYLDLETRIKNLKTSEKRLLEILAEAGTVEEILTVEQEISRVRGEIEAMTAEFTYLQDQVSFSTIDVFIGEEAIDTGGVSQKPFAHIGKRMKEALFQSINFVSTAVAFALVALATLLPVLVVLALVTLVVIWVVRAIRRRKSGVPPGGQPPAAG